MKVARYRWLIDAHNLILTHYNPEEDAGPAPVPHSELRRELEDAVQDFAAAHGTQACLVYDGTRLPGGRHPGARREPHLEVLYADPPAEADDLICQRAEQWTRDGGPPPAVVTSDRRTLIPRLGGIRVVGAREFRAMLETPPERSAPSGPTPSEPELERIFSAGGEEDPGPPLPREASGTPRRNHRASLAAKRERGRIRQLRRLAAHRRRPRRK